MKILLIGASGLLGKKLMTTIPKKHQVIPTYNKIKIPPHHQAIQLDITNQPQVQNVMKHVKPEIVIHAASHVYVDYCETHEKEAWNVNVFGTKNVLEAVKSHKIRFIFFSSNGVFDGQHPLYDEVSDTKAINIYGQTKLAAEKLVTKYLPNTIIFRLNTMYGWNYQEARKNPASWTIERLTKKQKTYVVTDVYNSHLWVGQASQAIWRGIEKNLYGEIINIGGKDCINRYEFCRLVAEVFHLDQQLLIPVTSDYFKNIAPRAKNTCFSNIKMRKLLKIKPIGVKQGLLRMKKEKQI